MGRLHGCANRTSPRTRPRQSSVAKKKRNADTMLFMVCTGTPSSCGSIWNRRRSPAGRGVGGASKDCPRASDVAKMLRCVSREKRHRLRQSLSWRGAWLRGLRSSQNTLRRRMHTSPMVNLPKVTALQADDCATSALCSTHGTRRPGITDYAASRCKSTFVSSG